MKKRNVVLALTAAIAGTALLAFAQDMGVTKSVIKIGTWGPQSGPGQAWGNVMVGIETMVNKVNAEGGINGRKIQLFKRDDAYEPARTKLVVKDLVERQGVFALVGGVGTPNGLAILNDVRANAIPWVSPATGSTEFSRVDNGRPKTPTVFASYTNYYTESVLLLRHAVNTLKLSKIGVFYINQSFGLEGSKGVEAEVKALGSKASLVAKVPHEPSETSMAVQALKLQQSDAEAVVLYTADAYAISLLREMAKLNYKPQILASSVLAGSTMFQAGPNTQWQGAIVASFLPFPSALLVDGKGDPKADAALADIVKYSPNPDAVKTDPFRILAGYAFAQPMMEGLRRAGPNLTRASFVKAMESIKNWKDSLFYSISYAADDRQGNNSVFLLKAGYAPKPGYTQVGGWVSFSDQK
jgi:ABC-type branched-subunit amino acid transport system substrate-binding protein